MIQIVDLQTKQLRTLPSSEGLFSPRWSPDGKYIAAMTLDEKHLMLFDTKSQQWKLLAELPLSDPVWSANGLAVYALGLTDPRRPIYRVSAPEGRVEEVAALGDFRAGETIDYTFSGLMPDNTLVVRTRITGDLYSLDLEGR